MELLTEEQAARRLGIGAKSLRKLRQQGLISYVAITTRKILYRPEDCDEYVQSRVRREKPTTPTYNVTRGRAAARLPRVVPFSEMMRREKEGK